MGKRLFWTALAGLATSCAQAAPPPSLPAAQLDWQPWGEDAPPNALCPGRYVMPEYQLAAGETPEEVLSVSDSAEYGDQGETLLHGEVVLRRSTAQLVAPKVRVNAARDTAFAEGPLALRDQGLLVRGESAQMALDSDAAQVGTAHYVLHESRLRGDAVQLSRLEDGRYRLNEASFTTCAPGSDAWKLVGNEVTINRAEGYGTATHARLEVADVPVFYWPWLRFPIDDRRQSGFLWPLLGFANGALDYAQPYYLNLAPNYDATVTPRWVTDHGLLMGGQFRYLFPEDVGQFEGAYIADDKGGGESDNPNDPDDAFEGEDRWYVDYMHRGYFTPRLRYNLRYGAASDGRYFDDFGRDFGESETEYLARLAQLSYSGTTWQLEARAQGYQNLEFPLDEDDKPFYRLPSLTANARWSQDTGFYQQWRSNVTRFWRDVDADDQGIWFDENDRARRIPIREAANGTRVHLSPAVGWRGETSWGFFEPRFELLHTAYQLDYGNRETDRDESLTRTVPVSSLDSGLIFERDVDLFGDAWRQTLEPRLYYAYVPERDQSEFPDFDTDEQAFSYDQLWSPYRFSGSDRIGDVNKLSYGVATRFLEDDSGRERLSLAVGQSAYFDERAIGIEGDLEIPDRENDPLGWYNATRDRSPIVTQLDWQINDQWSTRYAWFYDANREITESTAAYLRYRHPAGHVLNLGYRWQLEGFDPSGDAEDQLGYDREDYMASFAYKVGASWDLIGKFTYDNTNDRALEQLAGIQWNDCCYAVQVAWREWVEDNDTASTIEDDYTDRGIFLRFVFKGLGGVGQGADAFFEQAIPGYQPTQF